MVKTWVGFLQETLDDSHVQRAQDHGLAAASKCPTVRMVPTSSRLA
jgi:hypothetical protein